jgi:3-oxoacyl-(acyl-carrier-protein) synthase
VEAFLRQMGDGRPDFVVLHAPGTRQGDKAEWEAVKRVWGEVPALSVKAWVGHSLGVAPLVSLSWAMYLLSTQRWLELPYKPHWPSYPPQRWQEAVVLALGFGGVMGAIWIQKAAL